MPLYEYECLACGSRREVLQRFDAPPLTTCEDCGGQLTKLVSAPAFQFKGSGWYVTDYAGKSRGETSSEKKDGAKETTQEAAKPSDSDSTTSSKPKAPAKASAAKAGTSSTG